MEPQIQETGPDGVITEVALGLMAQRPDKWYPSGTAVVIAPHLALTARHVVDDYWRHFDQNWKLKLGDSHGDFGLLALQVLPGRQGVIWAIRRLWRSEHTDLAVLQLAPYSNLAAGYRWRCPMLQLLAPPVGAEVWTFGYRGGCADATFDDPRAMTAVHWRSSPSTAVGTVIEVHDVRRDHGMLKFPCFRTNAPFTHGMSGGPIFHAGRLSGIICAGGLQGGDGHEITYGVTLWPLLALKVQLDFAGQPSGSWYSVADLVDRGYVRVVDRERVAVTPDGECLLIDPPSMRGPGS
jgi:hypothetical protein